jgi:hypothetical protein
VCGQALTGPKALCDGSGVKTLSCRPILASAFFLALAGCQRQGPTFDDVPTAPNTPAPITPVTPIVVAPRPSPTPTDPPEDPPSDGGGTPNPENPVSTDPVARLLARVYFVECNGQLVPGSGNASEAPVGCRIHLDVTPKDSQGRPTRTSGTPRWTYSNAAIINASGDAEYTPTLTAIAPGSLTIGCTLDGVQSNTVRITLK